MRGKLPGVNPPAFVNAGVQIEGDGHRRVVFVHILDTRRVRIFLLFASTHDGNHLGCASDKRWPDAVIMWSTTDQAAREVHDINRKIERLRTAQYFETSR